MLTFVLQGKVAEYDGQYFRIEGAHLSPLRLLTVLYGLHSVAIVLAGRCDIAVWLIEVVVAVVAFLERRIVEGLRGRGGEGGEIFVHSGGLSDGRQRFQRPMAWVFTNGFLVYLTAFQGVPFFSSFLTLRCYCVPEKG
jgi:hypothetical protein